MRNSSVMIPMLRFLNISGAIGLLSSLIVTLVLQFYFFYLPCPLCLRRVGFFGLALDFILNLRYGFKLADYAIVLISPLFTGMIALRHIALHIVPGTGVYGTAIFGMHLYTWAFIIAAAALVITTLMLGLNKQYQNNIESHQWL